MEQDPSEAWTEAAGRAARAIADAEALVVTAGAGMGVDSGLPDFRGPEGFWRTYPPYARLGLDFAAVANPRWFDDDPAFAWGFYGHRLNLYRATRPHDGFERLRRWIEAAPAGGFVYTSNVDGHFQRSGFDPDRVVECHGAIDWLQCTADCGAGLFEAPSHTVVIDHATFRATDRMPQCHLCGALARPNILMFGDSGWDSRRSEDQGQRFEHWLDGVRGRKLAILECGAGTAIPTVRRLGESLAREFRAPLIRINLRDPAVPPGPHIGLASTAGRALAAIDETLAGRGSG